MGYVPTNAPTTTTKNAIRVKLKERIVSSLRHARDSISFLKLLKRVNTGSESDKYIDEFITAIHKDEQLYEVELTNIKDNKIEVPAKGNNDFGESTGHSGVLDDNTKKVKLDGNPLL